MRQGGIRPEATPALRCVSRPLPELAGRSEQARIVGRPNGSPPPGLAGHLGGIPCLSARFRIPVSGEPPTRRRAEQMILLWSRCRNRIFGMETAGAVMPARTRGATVQTCAIQSCVIRSWAATRNCRPAQLFCAPWLAARQALSSRASRGSARRRSGATSSGKPAATGPSASCRHSRSRQMLDMATRCSRACSGGRCRVASWPGCPGHSGTRSGRHCCATRSAKASIRARSGPRSSAFSRRCPGPARCSSRSMTRNGSTARPPACWRSPPAGWAGCQSGS